MKRQAEQIVYVEICRQLNHRGRASIRRVRFSRSGRAVYVGRMLLNSCRGAGIVGNYYNPVTGIEYWISGPKKKGGDRHWAGGGPVFVEDDVREEYWRDIRQCAPPVDPRWA